MTHLCRRHNDLHYRTSNPLKCKTLMIDSAGPYIDGLQGRNRTKEKIELQHSKFSMKSPAHSHLLIFFMAVMTSLNPCDSNPHPSVTYFKVKKLPCVIILPTDCFVFRHDMSNCKYTFNKYV